ncbi:MAG: hypothetical protein AB8B65_01765 [Kordia sp.]|uniref:hypothetical protein n=1 Tax=Kordia sp. TaxID=1965332 RepID=UPI00385CBAF7
MDTSNSNQQITENNANQNPNVVYVQKSDNAPAILIILGIFTILGSLVLMTYFLFFYSVASSVSSIASDFTSENVQLLPFISYLYAPACVGTLIGAVMMITKKMKGLYVYSICQVVFIFAYIINNSSYAFAGDFFVYTLLLLVPSLLFLGLYWSKDIKKHLS